MRCAICNGYIKDGTGNNHHVWFPKKKFKGTRKGRLTVQVHIMCHQRFHYYFLHECLSKKTRNCRDCQYNKICCYAEVKNE